MLAEILIWLFLIELFSFLSLPFTLLFFKKAADKGYSASKAAGIAIFSYISWLMAFPFGSNLYSLIVSAAILIAAACIVFFKKRESIHGIIEKNKEIFFKVEFLFLCLFLIFILLRMQTPEINSLEKFMDFAFVNSIAHGESMPPMDPWYSGGNINYYYFGHYITGVFSKLSGIGTNISYNLMFSTYYSMFAIIIFSVVFSITKKFRYGIFSIILVCILGNSFGMIQLVTFAFPGISVFFSSNLELDYPINCCWNPSADFFENAASLSLWPSTRIIPDTINEFPFSSFLFGDLHSHYNGFAFLAMFILVCIEIFYNEDRISPWKIIFLSFFLGIIAVFNIWYFATACLLLAVCIFSRYSPKESVFTLILTGIISIILFSPFYLTVSAPQKEIAMVSERISPVHLIIIFSLPFFVIGYYIFSMRRFLSDRKFIAILFFASFLTAVFLNMYSAILLVPLLAACTRLLFSKEMTREVAFALIISAVSTFLLISTDLVFFESRMNNIFKIFLVTWILYGTASACIISSIKKSRIFYFMLLSIITINMIVPFLVTFSNITISNEKTLDGTSYLLNIDPGAYRSIEWIKRNLKDYPVILESPGRAYTSDSIISANTGFPTVIGWVNHEFLWRGEWFIQRENDVNEIYSTIDQEKTLNLLSKYNVSYIYVGMAEKEKYPLEGLSKFDVDEHYLKVFGNLASIYKVRHD